MNLLRIEFPPPSSLKEEGESGEKPREEAFERQIKYNERCPKDEMERNRKEGRKEEKEGVSSTSGQRLVA